MAVDDDRRRSRVFRGRCHRGRPPDQRGSAQAQLGVAAQRLLRIVAAAILLGKLNLPLPGHDVEVRVALVLGVPPDERGG